MGSGSSFCVGCLLVSAVVLFLCPDAQLGIGYILGLFACSVLLKPGGFYLGVDNSLGVFILWVLQQGDNEVDKVTPGSIQYLFQ